MLLRIYIFILIFTSCQSSKKTKVNEQKNTPSDETFYFSRYAGVVSKRLYQCNYNTMSKTINCCLNSSPNSCKGNVASNLFSKKNSRYKMQKINCEQSCSTLTKGKWILNRPFASSVINSQCKCLKGPTSISKIIRWNSRKHCQGKGCIIEKRKNLNVNKMSSGTAQNKCKGNYKKTTLKLKFINATFGDLAWVSFKDKKNKTWRFVEAEPHGVSFLIMLPKTQMNEENQGWAVNPKYIEKWFHVTFQDGCVSVADRKEFVTKIIKTVMIPK